MKHPGEPVQIKSTHWDVSHLYNPVNKVIFRGIDQQLIRHIHCRLKDRWPREVYWERDIEQCLKSNGRGMIRLNFHALQGIPDETKPPASGEHVRSASLVIRQAIKLQLENNDK